MLITNRIARNYWIADNNDALFMYAATLASLAGFGAIARVEAEISFIVNTINQAPKNAS